MMKLLRILLPLCLLFVEKSMAFHKYNYGSVTLGTRLTRDLSKRRLHITLDDKTETLSIKKYDFPGISRRPSRRSADMELYASADMNTVCTNEYFEGDTSLICMKQSPNGYSYIRNKRAVYVENEQSMNLPSTEDLLRIRDAIDRQTGSESMEHSRKRRMASKCKRKKLLITPSISSDTALIKMRMMMDVAFFTRFLDLVGGDVDEAKAEIECFMVIVLNQAALYYNNLKDLGASFSSSDGQQYKVDFMPTLYDIVYPPQNLDGSFYDLPPLVNNRDGRFLVTKVYDNSEGNNNIVFDVFGFVIDFGIYQKATYPDPQPYNLIHFISGDYFSFDFYNRTSNDTNDDVFVRREPLEGMAYIGSLCGLFDGPFDGRKGFSSLNSSNIGRIVAHEIGHNLGCFHDTSEKCPSEKVNLMSVLYLPPTADAPDYYKWSECSGEEIVNYFTFLNLTSAQIAECLFTDNPTEEDFINDFCKGLLGSRYGLNETCELVYGNKSYICPNGNSNVAAGYVDADKCQTTNGPCGLEDYLPLLYCSKDDICENSPNELYGVFDGTKCANSAGLPQGKQVCYRGECVNNLKVCSGAAAKSKGKFKKSSLFAQ